MPKDEEAASGTDESAAGEEIAVLRTNLARYQYKLERDRRYLEFSRRLLGLYRHGDAARRRGEAAFRLPDFYVIGSPRCATTWLKIALAGHPDILMLRSEPSVFTHHLDRSPDEGLARYAPTKDSFFGSRSFDPDRYDRLLIGEKSPEYVTMGPSRLRFFLDLNPTARFIQLCREPGERLWSHVLHQFADDRQYIDRMLEANSVEESMRTNPRAWRFIERSSSFGFYRRHIEAWRAELPDDRLLVASFHDIVDAPDASLRRFLDFLDVDPDRLDPVSGPAPQSASVPVGPPAYFVDWARDLYGDEPAFVASLSRAGR